ncbi:MAG TPA: type II toxin-antitoxin system VapB family antitoxin [Solirubrobacterales bacterium]|nr:type II toxin-antitoxin system VapB family antitoxin [Solirubrobacterales bacterium]
MSKTSIEIDESKLGAVREILGTGSMRETVDAALSEVIDRRRRERLVEQLASERIELRRPDVIDAAWR